MKYKLKDIALVQMGLSFRSRIEPDADGNIAVIQMRDLTEDKLGYRALTTININDIDEHHLVERKDLVFRSRGRTTTAAIIDREPGRAVVAAPLFLIRATSENVLPEYLCWFINLSSSQAFLHRRATGTAITMIGKSALGALEIPLPNLKTQARIVALADLLNKEQRLMKNLADQKGKLVRAIQMRLATGYEKTLDYPHRTGAIDLTIGIGKYSFEGPFGDTSDLRHESGVYVILGRHSIHRLWQSVDIGESEDVKKRVETHDRKYAWKSYPYLSYAAYYCPATDRGTIAGELLGIYDPPYGDR